MTHREQIDSDGDRRWQSLVCRAQQAPAEVVPPIPAGFVDQVMAELPRHASAARARGAERLVAASAGLAVAASLLLAVLSWQDIESVLSAGPTSLEQIVQLEPVP